MGETIDTGGRTEREKTKWDHVAMICRKRVGITLTYVWRVWRHRERHKGEGFLNLGWDGGFVSRENFPTLKWVSKGGVGKKVTGQQGNSCVLHKGAGLGTDRWELCCLKRGIGGTTIP